MEADGYVAAGDRGALRVSPAGAVRRRAGDPDDGRAGVAGANAVRLRGRAAPTARSLATGSTVHAALDRGGRPCRLPGARHRQLLRMKALVTGAAGFIGSHLRERAARSRRRGASASTASPTTTRGRSRKRNLAAPDRPRRASVRRGRHAGRRPAGAARRRHARLPPRRPGRRPQELGTRFQRLHGQQHRGDAGAARGVRRPASSSGSSTRRARRSTATTWRMPMREDDAAAAGLAVRRDQARGRAALLPLPRQPRRADGVAALLHGLRPAAAARHGLPPVPARRAARASRSRCTATASRRATSRSSPTWPSAAHLGGRPRACPGASTISAAAPACRSTRCSRHRSAESPASPVYIDRQPAQKGDMRDTYADTSLARADLGFAPTVSLADGLAAEYAWLKPSSPAHLAPHHITRDAPSLSSFRVAWRRAAGRLRRSPCCCARRCCAKKATTIPTGTAEPDKFLFDRGTEALNAKKWLTAREFFQHASSTTTRRARTGPTRSSASATPTSAKAPRNRWCWRSTSTRNSCRSTPPAPRADYAQYKLAMCHFPQMRRPERDQTETREALHEFETFCSRVPEQPADAGGAGAS